MAGKLEDVVGSEDGSGSGADVVGMGVAADVAEGSNAGDDVGVTVALDEGVVDVGVGEAGRVVGAVALDDAFDAAEGVEGGEADFDVGDVEVGEAPLGVIGEVLAWPPPRLWPVKSMRVMASPLARSCTSRD